MLFWTLAVLLTIGACLAVLLPLAAGATTRASGQRHDVEVYSDQLTELERDAARGLIKPAEADEARAEIARRLLKAAEPERLASEGRAPRLSRMVGAAAVLAIPLISWSLYAEIGSPDIPGQPLKERLARSPADASIDELVARAEAHLASSPEDGRGWDVLAPVYARMGRYDDAAAAYRNAIRLLGSTGERQSGLGEAIASAADGVVTTDAQAAFEASIAADKNDFKARYYLATALAQEGKMDAAAAAWNAMLADLPAQTPWRGAVEEALAEVERRRAVASAPPAPGPDAAAIDAASAMAPADRTAMIETMVATLDGKLRENPKDPEGWLRLVRSYAVLGKTDDARAALARGLDALDRTSADGKALAALGATLGLATVE